MDGDYINSLYANYNLDTYIPVITGMALQLAGDQCLQQQTGLEMIKNQRYLVKVVLGILTFRLELLT